eukprot:scaffold907_cov247-Pinguiococcus_pyrenoidosus.AAC.3
MALTTPWPKRSRAFFAPFGPPNRPQTVSSPPTTEASFGRRRAGPGSHRTAVKKPAQLSF